MLSYSGIHAEKDDRVLRPTTGSKSEKAQHTLQSEIYRSAALGENHPS
jgi:hypothetical protein